MSAASSDPKHPGVRCSYALENLLGRIYGDTELQKPGHTRSSSSHQDAEVNANRSHSPIISSRHGTNDLPAFLGNRESSFVAERSFHDLAADLDALFGVTPNTAQTDVQLAVDGCNISSNISPFDPFASIFNTSDTEAWDPFTLDWTTL